MGVDNNAYLVVGVETDSKEYKKIRESESIKYFESEGVDPDEDELDEWMDDDDMLITDYGGSTDVFGYVVVDSGSYGYEVMEWVKLQKEIEKYIKRFIKEYGVGPKIIIMNHQW